MRESRGRYKFHNENPKNLLRASDCVVRALAFTLDKKWDNVLRDLTEIALELKNTPTSDQVFEEYLKRQGYPKERQLRKEDGTKYTVDEFAEYKDEGTFIVRVAGHLTSIKDGYVYDTWDCRHKTTGNYWKIK